MVSTNPWAISVASMWHGLFLMYKRSAGLVAVVVVRILVAIEPQMYGEVLAFHIRQQRPQAEVVLASPQTLQAEAERMKPHMIVADEVSAELKEMVVLWMQVRKDDSLNATIGDDGHATIDDVTLQDLLAAVDKAEEELAHEA